MKMKLLFLTLMVFSWGAAADNGVFKEYDLEILDMPQTWPVEKVNDVKAKVLTFGDAVTNCAPTGGEWENFAIDRTFYYVIAPKGFGCGLNMVVYSGRSYNCFIPNSLLDDLGKAIKERAETGDLLGDFSEVEKEIFFEDGYCT